uniref:Uncharacterized protein n=1 Tax=Magallana gigas TaxID=29159 RepID=K1RMA2_MAGGI
MPSDCSSTSKDFGNQARLIVSHINGRNNSSTHGQFYNHMYQMSKVRACVLRIRSNTKENLPQSLQGHSFKIHLLVQDQGSARTSYLLYDEFGYLGHVNPRYGISVVCYE